MAHLKYSSRLLLITLILHFIANDVNSQRTQQRVRCIPGRTQFPNPNDRTTFYKCDAGGNPILFGCPAGTWFNPALEVCDWDTEGENNNNNNNPGTEDDGSDDDNGGADWWSKPTTEKPTTSPPSNDNENPQKPTDNGRCNPSGPTFIRNVDDCKSFFMCSEGRLIMTTCPEGQYYNPDRVRCDASVPRGCTVVKDDDKNKNNNDGDEDDDDYVWHFRRSLA